ncbi:MAG TPA: hypothetical protein VHQ41_00450 [Patescibacteria group bacterium]|jgi:hypothetical protein|nr:hypothetical protein [Patescibacteria group bacterium]
MTPGTGLTASGQLIDPTEEKRIRQSLKRLIGKARNEEVRQIFIDLPSKDSLQHMVSQTRYQTSLLECAEHHYHTALHNVRSFQAKLKLKPQFAANPDAQQKLACFKDRAEKLLDIVVILNNAGLGIYPSKK